MIVLKKDFKHCLVSLKISFTDDLWYLSELIEPGDTVTGKTERKIKIGDAGSSNAKVTRKTMTLSILVEDVSLSDTGDVLRVKGTVKEGTDDVPASVYHTINLSIDSSFKLIKPEWPQFMKKRLDEAINNSAESVLFVLFDREKTLFSIVRQSGIEHLSERKNGTSGKRYDAASGSGMYAAIVGQVEDYMKSQSPSGIVVGCPDFWKQYIQKAFHNSSITKQPVFVTVTAVDRAVIHKLLSRPELHALLQTQRLQKEQAFVDRLLEQLDKELVAYGFDDVDEAAVIGAVSEVGVSDTFLQKSRQDGWYEKLNRLLSTVDSSQGSIHLLKGENTTKIVDGLGGIVGILRWKLQ
ncbi:MAG: hypothetical protein ACQESE_00830 [Nanobdellota archaeon]